MVKPAHRTASIGDYQRCLCLLAKVLGRSPRDIAAEIVKRLPTGDMLEPARMPAWVHQSESERPIGWRNNQMRDDRTEALPRSEDLRDRTTAHPTWPSRCTFGHLRSTIHWRFAQRIWLQFLGHRWLPTITGDWGTQFGMLLYGYKVIPQHDATAGRSDPPNWARVPARASLTKGQEDDVGESTLAKSRGVFGRDGEAQSGDAPRTWPSGSILRWTMDTVEALYRALDVQFDCYHGESFYSHMLAGVVESLLKQRLATESKRRDRDVPARAGRRRGTAGRGGDPQEGRRLPLT